MLDDFKIGCMLLAGFAQSFWDSLNVFEQIVAVVAGVIGTSLVLGCTGGWIAGLIGRRIRARQALTPDEKRALSHLHYDPILEFGGPCYVCERYEPVNGFDFQGQADMWLEQCQRAYWPSEEE